MRKENIMALKIIIGTRMGKGEAIKAGAEKAFKEAGVEGTAICIPGMAADMRLGAVIKQENADLGISQCGSGGAGAITASTMLGWKQKSQIDSADGAATAVHEGYRLIGMRFNDTEEVGYKIARALIEESSK